MIRIETTIIEGRKILHLSGDLCKTELEEFATHLHDAGTAVVLDLRDLKIVDRTAIESLLDWEESGIRIQACSPYVREWMNREGTGGTPTSRPT